METANIKKLKEAIIKNSESKDWYVAKKEWSIYDVEKNNGNCACGQHIKNIFYIKNKYTNIVLPIGNVCIKHFNEHYLTITAKEMWERKQTDKRDAYVKAITSAYRKNYISTWEYNFSLDIMKFKKKTPKQLATHEKIVEKIKKRNELCKTLQ
jgi:hypothetical protein